MFPYSQGVPHALMLVHAQFQSMDIGRDTATTMLSVTSLVDLSARLGVGYVADSRLLSFNALAIIT